MKTLASLLFLVLISAQVSAAPVTITVPAIPATVEEFTTLRDNLALTAEGGAAILVVALMVFVKDRPLGEQFLTIALDRENISEGTVYKGFRPASHLYYHLDRLSRPGYTHLPFAYVGGATPDNRYETRPPFSMTFSRNRFSERDENTIKVFIHSAGIPSPRPITMKKNDRGIWKGYELSSLFLNVAPPRTTTKDEL